MIIIIIIMIIIIIITTIIIIMLLLEVRRSGMIKTEDCKDKKHYKTVKVTETVSRWTE